MTETFALLKRPSGWLPPVMSLCALTLLLLYLAVFGLSATRSGDEGIAAYLFQALMLFQIPVGLWFAVRCMPNMPKQALPVLALQAVAWLTVFATIWLLEHPEL
jgi:hypothetical protein